MSEPRRDTADPSTKIGTNDPATLRRSQTVGLVLVLLAAVFWSLSGALIKSAIKDGAGPDGVTTPPIHVTLLQYLRRGAPACLGRVSTIVPTANGRFVHISFLKPVRPKAPIVSREAYSAFVAIMFSAAMLTWTATFLGFVTPSVSSLAGPSDSTTKATTSGGEAAETGSDSSTVLPGLPKGRSLVLGILYGIVLICLYWLYSETLAGLFLPTNLGMLFLDFVAMSFMAGAAAAWRNHPLFISLALATMAFLSARFLMPAVSEMRQFTAGAKKFPQMLMTHILIVFVLCIVFLAGFYLSIPDLQDSGTSDRLFWVLCFGMFVGIAMTTWHSFSYVPLDDTQQRTAVAFDRAEPLLHPAYGAIPADKLAQRSRWIFSGESQFRQLLCSVDAHWLSPFEFHRSRVHTYRDVETQAFIMAGYTKDKVEAELRAMWVWLAHWLDDVFDDQYATTLANMDLVGDFSIADTLGALDDRFARVWHEALARTAQHANWNRTLFDLGIRRLILSGPMFSAGCKPRHGAISQAHVKLIDLALSGDHGVKELVRSIEQTHPRYLEYTSKVVVEIWDSFTPTADFDLSMLMNLFYAPGLFYHDAEEESRFDQVILGPGDQEDGGNSIGETLDRVIALLLGLPEEPLGRLIEPVPLFVGAFETVLRRKGLLWRYKNFLDAGIRPSSA